MGLDNLFAQLANTRCASNTKPIPFSVHLFGRHRFTFYFSPDWPHQAICAALLGMSNPDAQIQSDWQILALTVAHERIADLVKPYARNRYGQLMPSRFADAGAALGHLAFYDPLAQTLRAYDFDRQRAYILVSPGHVFAEWEMFSPFKEFWHYWALFHESLVVHSGAVCQADQALVILGPGGAGKSTTTVSCIESGMQTTGDDFNVLAMVDGQIWVYPLFRTIKVKVGNALIGGFTCLARWTSQSYAAHQKIIYFPPSDDAMWQTKGAQLRAFVEPQWQARDSSSAPRAAPAIQSAVSAILQHPYLGERYLQRMKRMMAQCPSHALQLSAQPFDNVARIRALLASPGSSPACA